MLANERRGERRRTRLVLRLLHLAGEPEVRNLERDVAHAQPDRQLSRALSALPEPDRELLRLAYWDELTQAQIASVNGLRAFARLSRRESHPSGASRWPRFAPSSN